MHTHDIYVRGCDDWYVNVLPLNYGVYVFLDPESSKELSLPRIEDTTVDPKANANSQTTGQCSKLPFSFCN